MVTNRQALNNGPKDMACTLYIIILYIYNTRIYRYHGNHFLNPLVQEMTVMVTNSISNKAPLILHGGPYVVLLPSIYASIIHIREQPSPRVGT